MERYGDEGFIRLIRQGQEESRNRDIQKGSVWINGSELLFVEREVFKKKLWMWMPDSFTLLPKELAHLKYPNESRPGIIYTGKETTTNVTFALKSDKMNPGQEEEFRDYMEQILLRLYPSSNTIGKGTEKSGKLALAWFDFITPAIDSEIYNLMFYTALEGKLLMGTMNCLSADQDGWQEYFMQMLASMRTA